MVRWSAEVWTGYPYSFSHSDFFFFVNYIFAVMLMSGFILNEFICWQTPWNHHPPCCKSLWEAPFFPLHSHSSPYLPTSPTLTEDGEGRGRPGRGRSSGERKLGCEWRSNDDGGVGGQVGKRPPWALVFLPPSPSVSLSPSLPPSHPRHLRVTPRFSSRQRGVRCERGTAGITRDFVRLMFGFSIFCIFIHLTVLRE